MTNVGFTRVLLICAIAAALICSGRPVYAQRGSAVVYKQNPEYVELSVNTASLGAGRYISKVEFLLSVRTVGGAVVSQRYSFTDATLPTINPGNSLTRYFHSANGALATIGSGSFTWI